jgi:hypothetical protein
MCATIQPFTGQKENLNRQAQLQTRIGIRHLLLAALMVLLGRSSQSPLAAATTETAMSAAPGLVFRQTYSGMPRLDYSKLPWLTQPASAQDGDAKLQALMAELTADLATASSGLAALGDSLTNDQPNATATRQPTPLAGDSSTCLAQDLSNLSSQDLSVNCGQLLSTSMAVLTAPPRPKWANKPGTAVVTTPNGDVVVPTYPARTAWGNGGMVVTTPGGAVFWLVPSAPQASRVADAGALRQVGRQLELVRNDVERLQSLLANNNTSTNFPMVLQ